MPRDDVAEAEKLQGSLRLPQELCDSIIDHLHNDATTLKACSLVCKAWLPSAGLHLFSTLACLPCPHPGKHPQTKDSKGIRSADGFEFKHCLVMLTSSRRIASVVSHLKLSTRQLHQSMLPRLRLSTLKQMINSLPRVRVIEFVDCRIEEDILPSAFCHMHDDLEVRFAAHSTPDHPFDWHWDEVRVIPALSPIQKLVIRGPLSIYSLGYAQDLPVHTKPAHVDTFEAHWSTSTSSSITLYFHCFQRYIDFTSLRVLTLNGPLCDGPVTFLDPAPLALEKLTYHVTGSSPSLGAWTSLRAVTLVGEFFTERDVPSEWLDIVRDLHAMPIPELRDVCIVLRVYEDPYWAERGRVTPVDVPFERLRRSLVDQDWARLAACLARFAALQTLRLEMELYSFSRSDGKFTSDVARCIRIMQDVVAASLPQTIVAVTTVGAVARCPLRQSMHRSPETQ